MNNWIDEDSFIPKFEPDQAVQILQQRNINVRRTSLLAYANLLPWKPKREMSRGENDEKERGRKTLYSRAHIAAIEASYKMVHGRYDDPLLWELLGESEMIQGDDTKFTGVISALKLSKSLVRIAASLATTNLVQVNPELERFIFQNIESRKECCGTINKEIIKYGKHTNLIQWASDVWEELFFKAL